MQMLARLALCLSFCFAIRDSLQDEPERIVLLLPCSLAHTTSPCCARPAIAVVVGDPLDYCLSESQHTSSASELYHVYYDYNTIKTLQQTEPAATR